MKRTLTFGLIVLLFLTTFVSFTDVVFTSSVPKLPMPLAGDVYINGNRAEEGTSIKANCSDGSHVWSEKTQVSKYGKYGYDYLVERRKGSPWGSETKAVKGLHTESFPWPKERSCRDCWIKLTGNFLIGSDVPPNIPEGEDVHIYVNGKEAVESPVEFHSGKTYAEKSELDLHIGEVPKPESPPPASNPIANLLEKIRNDPSFLEKTGITCNNQIIETRPYKFIKEEFLGPWWDKIRFEWESCAKPDSPANVNPSATVYYRKDSGFLTRTINEILNNPPKNVHTILNFSLPAVGGSPDHDYSDGTYERQWAYWVVLNSSDDIIHSRREGPVEIKSGGSRPWDSKEFPLELNESRVKEGQVRSFIAEEKYVWKGNRWYKVYERIVDKKGAGFNIIDPQDDSDRDGIYNADDDCPWTSASACPPDYELNDTGCCVPSNPLPQDVTRSDLLKTLNASLKDGKISAEEDQTLTVMLRRWDSDGDGEANRYDECPHQNSSDCSSDATFSDRKGCCMREIPKPWSGKSEDIPQTTLAISGTSLTEATRTLRMSFLSPGNVLIGSYKVSKSDLKDAGCEISSYPVTSEGKPFAYYENGRWKQTDVTDISGKGYWVRLKKGCDLSVPIHSAFDKLTLEDGANELISVRSAVTKSELEDAGCTFHYFQNPDSSTGVRKTFATYMHGRWHMTDKIKPVHGYWVAVNEGCTYDLGQEAKEGKCYDVGTVHAGGEGGITCETWCNEYFNKGEGGMVCDPDTNCYNGYPAKRSISILITRGVRDSPLNFGAHCREEGGDLEKCACSPPEEVSEERKAGPPASQLKCGWVPLSAEEGLKLSPEVLCRMRGMYARSACGPNNNLAAASEMWHCPDGPCEYYNTTSRFSGTWDDDCSKEGGFNYTENMCGGGVCVCCCK